MRMKNGRYGLAAPFPAPVPAGRPSSRRDRTSFGRARCSVRPGASETVPSAGIDDLAGRPLRSGAGKETNHAGDISGSANAAKRTRRDHRCFALVKSPPYTNRYRPNARACPTAHRRSYRIFCWLRRACGHSTSRNAKPAMKSADSWLPTCASKRSARRTGAF